MAEAVEGRPSAIAQVSDAAVVAALGAACALTFEKLLRYGWASADYTHAYFVIPIWAWLVLRKRASLESTDEIRPWPAALFLAGLGMYLFGAVNRFLFLEAGGMVALICGLAGLKFTRESVRQVRFALLYLVFLVPPPSLAIDLVTVPLRQLSAQASAALLWMLRVPVEVSGVVLTVGRHELFVNDACSGFRSMVTLLALSSLYAHLQPLTPVGKWLLTLMVIPLAIAGNIVRICLTALIAWLIHPRYAEGLFHTVSGLVVFLVALGGVAMVANFLIRIEEEHGDFSD
jgi:exosortase